MAYGRYGGYGTGAGRGSILPVGAPSRVSAESLSSRGYASSAPHRVSARSFFAGQAYGQVQKPRRSYGAGEVEAVAAAVSTIFETIGMASKTKAVKHDAGARITEAEEGRKGIETSVMGDVEKKRQRTRMIAIGGGIAATVATVGALLYFGTK